MDVPGSIEKFPRISLWWTRCWLNSLEFFLTQWSPFFGEKLSKISWSLVEGSGIHSFSGNRCQFYLGLLCAPLLQFFFQRFITNLAICSSFSVRIAIRLSFVVYWLSVDTFWIKQASRKWLPHEVSAFQVIIHFISIFISVPSDCYCHLSSIIGPGADRNAWEFFLTQWHPALGWKCWSLAEVSGMHPFHGRKMALFLRVILNCLWLFFQGLNTHLTIVSLSI